MRKSAPAIFIETCRRAFGGRNPFTLAWSWQVHHPTNRTREPPRQPHRVQGNVREIYHFSNAPQYSHVAYRRDWIGLSSDCYRVTVAIRGHANYHWSRISIRGKPHNRCVVLFVCANGCGALLLKTYPMQLHVRLNLWAPTCFYGWRQQGWTAPRNMDNKYLCVYTDSLWTDYRWWTGLHLHPFNMPYALS